ncbi:uncharacterized protein LOC142635224 [Castanea sativa]|uniref:uncharacterized protein LOC142635224 n=1 Tax=Castanea sativa TaxID=21020 RepID=UPI003F653DC4
MSKAYNRVEWRFLTEIMSKMGFCEAWIKLIFNCISSVSYSILVNGEPRGNIVPSRRIRQGNPLSPYLFLLCSEWLNRLLQRAAQGNQIRGCSLCKTGPKVTHLFFADNSLLFCQAKLTELEAVQRILAVYEQASGQQINRGKTTLFFRKVVAEETKEEIINLLGVPEVKEYEKYLGLPAVVGRKRKASLNYIKERVWNKLQGWKERLLSQAGREVLLKAVMQVIPTYAMSCFKLPVALCEDIEKLIRKFWWGECGSVFNAKKSQGSYAWQSIWKFPTKAVPNRLEAISEAKVSSMIDPDSREWNMELLENCNLYRRKVIGSPVCSTCGKHEETTLHALWDCTAIQSVWGLNFKATQNDSHGISSFSDLIGLVELHQENLELFVVVAWSIWLARNKGRVNEPCAPLGKIFKAARSILSEFQTKRIPRQSVAPSNTVKWKPSRSNFYEVNYDRVVLKDSGEAGLGVVIRNEKGEVVGSLAEKIKLPDSIEVLEALAARKAILFAIELGLQRVIIEGDSEIIFKALSESCSDCSHIGHIIKDCKSISSLFQTHSFSHTRRQGNAVAHALAKRARKSFPLLVWMESVPPAVACLVHIDVIS